MKNSATGQMLLIPLLRIILRATEKCEDDSMMVERRGQWEEGGLDSEPRLHLSPDSFIVWEGEFKFRRCRQSHR